MKFTAAFAAALATAVSGTKIELGDEQTPLNLQKIADEVNSQDLSWKAVVHPRFQNATVADAKRILGTILSGEEGYTAPETMREVFPGGDIPEAFDSREAFSSCANIIGHVRDQSNCGSCWAFSSTESFNDRYCMATGDATTLMAPEDTVSCCSGRKCSFSMGCNGGQPAGAWSWFTETGVTTGGDNSDVGSGTSCKPYSMTSCAHHVEPTGDMPACDDVETYSTPKCTSTCNEATYPTSFSDDKHFAKTSYGIKGEENMQREIMEKGPISVAFTVYEDFEAYSSGVYQHVSGRNLGGHAVKMIGWGVDNGTPYWSIINSWNDSWGEKGLFRIIRGQNECGIENDGVAGDV
jgi:cathepsin B